MRPLNCALLPAAIALTAIVPSLRGMRDSPTPHCVASPDTLMRVPYRLLGSLSDLLGARLNDERDWDCKRRSLPAVL